MQNEFWSIFFIIKECYFFRAKKKEKDSSKDVKEVEETVSGEGPEEGGDDMKEVEETICKEVRKRKVMM